MRHRVMLSAALSATLSAACAPEPDSTSRADGPDPGVVCVGASFNEARSERHPMILRGVLSAPPPRTSSLLPGWLVPSARAFAMEFERPVSGAPVSLLAVDASGAPVGAPLRVTTTDSIGRYCIRIPDGSALGAGLALSADVSGRTLRRALAVRSDASIDAQSEARYRVLQRAEVDLTRLDPAAYLNWRTVADTRVGLLSDVSMDRARALDELVPELAAALESGERGRAALEALKGTPKNE